jgi:hypothetical protein
MPTICNEVGDTPACGEGWSLSQDQYQHWHSSGWFSFSLSSSCLPLVRFRPIADDAGQGHFVTKANFCGAAMLKRFLDFLDPLRNAEPVLKRYFLNSGVEALAISLVRLKGEFKVVFALPQDAEQRTANPITLAPETLDDLIAFLQECRSRAT